VYRDRDGWLWLDPGNGELSCLDRPLLHRIRDKWPTTPLPGVEDEFGPLDELTGSGITTEALDLLQHIAVVVNDVAAVDRVNELHARFLKEKRES
jgi:hypothetical protein